MALRRRGKVLLVLFGVLMLLAAVAVFVMFGPPDVAERLARPEFCRSCHVMEPQYATYVRGTHSEAAESCNDCHLPNNSFVRHWLADAFVGTRDLVEWNLNLVPEYITATPRSRRWIAENCRRCHADLTQHVELAEGRWCWDCHRQVQHQIAGRRDRSARQAFKEKE